MAHTPESWKWIKHEYGDYYELVDSTGARIHSDGSANGEYSPDIDVNGPDARLIAAAPELLEACKDLLMLIEEHGTPIIWAHATRIMSARAAIAKAEEIPAPPEEER